MYDCRVTTIMDPYRPDDYDATRWRLSKSVLDGEYKGEIFKNTGTAVAMSAAAACMGGAVAAFIGGDIDTAASLALFFSATTFTVAFGFFFVQYVVWRRQCAAMRRHENPAYVVTVSPSTRDLIDQSASALRAIPRDQRVELRPLWLAAVEASNFIRDNGYDDEMMSRVRERRDALVAHRRACDKVEEEARQIELRQKKDAARSSISTDDTDLAMARIYTEALDAGRRRYAELNRAHA